MQNEIDITANANLLATKLTTPSIPAQWIQRPQLKQLLDEGLALKRQLTLVSAPAGFGKTTCISEWIHSLQNWPVGWLSLDTSDDDPGHFLTYLIAALQKINPGLGQEILNTIHTGQIPPNKIISTKLINDILRVKNDFLLVIDDFQVIQDKVIFEILDTLICNLPHQLYLVLITREDPPLPLARLRANGQLTEIRAKDLRFSIPDITRFMNEEMGLSLADSEIVELENKTEGWAAGLQLAGLSMRNRDNPSDFITTLSGSHRAILSYLTEQVLNQQTQEIQQFLLQTAILDKLNSDLCDTLTQRPDSRNMLEHLCNANLFLTPINDNQHWYRYHPLFGDLLRELQRAKDKDHTKTLHQRAGQWFAQANMIHEAMHHTLSAEDFDLAVQLLEKHAMQMIMQGYVKTVNNWVQAIPPEYHLQSPKTNLAFTWMHLLRGAYALAMPYLDNVQKTISHFPTENPSQEENTITAEWLVMQSLILNMQGKAIESLTTAKQALKICPEQDNRVLSLAYYALAGIHQLREDYPQAVEAYQKAIQHSRSAHNMVAEVMSTVGLARMAFEHGQLHLAHEIAAPVCKRIEQSGSLTPISSVLFGLLGEIYYQWNRIEEGKHNTQRAYELGIWGGYNTGTIFCLLLLSRLALLEGDLETSAEKIQKAADLIPPKIPDYIRQELTAQQVALYLARNQAGAAEMTLQGVGFAFQPQFTYPQTLLNQPINHSIGLLFNSSLRFLLYKTQAEHNTTELETGMALAGMLIESATACNYLVVALDALLLRARMYRLSEDESSLHNSRADIGEALSRAAPEGFMGVFFEQGQDVVIDLLTDFIEHNPTDQTIQNFIKDILKAPPKAQPDEAFSKRQVVSSISPYSGLIDPLSEREIEVLQLMAEGLKYKEMAERLFISLNTVRFHIKTIYGKLNANNRTQAIKKAYQHNLIPPTPTE